MLDEVLENTEFSILLTRRGMDGVFRIKKFSRHFSNSLEIQSSLIRAGNDVVDMIRYFFLRGDYAEEKSFEILVKKFLSENVTSIDHCLPSGRYMRAKFNRTDRNGLVITFLDVTALRKREDELVAAYAIFDEVLREIGQGLIIFSGIEVSEARCTIMNTRLAELMELPEHMSRVGLSYEEMFEFVINRGDLDEESLARLDKLRDATQDVESMKLIYRLPSGRTVQSYGGPRADGNGRIVTFTDISDIVQSEQERDSLMNELSHVQRLEAVGQLTGGIAHDFNNLLAIISGNTELLQMEYGYKDENLKDIHSAARRGAELTQRLLAFSRKQALQPTALDLTQQLEEWHGLLTRTLGELIDVRAYADDNLWRCLADEGQVENAILNLAVNARDAMPKGGSLTIHVSNETIGTRCADQCAKIDAGEYVKISVRDTGIGMTKDVVKKAFDPFYTTKDVGKGSGLGLSMVYGFVKQSNGGVMIDSLSGEGSTVSILLPRTNEPAEPPKVEQRLLTNSRRNKTIIIVEDDHDVRAMVVRSLSQLGYTTRAFINARDALCQLSEDDNIDLLLTDIVLPEGMSGARLGRELLSRKPDLKILYMSGYTKGVAVENDELDASVQLLQKPFSISELSSLVQQVLQSSRPHLRSDGHDDRP